MFCTNCGKELTGTPEFCTNCGVRIAKVVTEEISPKSRLATTLFAWFLGVFGAHRFYLGKIGTGLAMLFTLGGLGIWALIDFIYAVSGLMKDREGKLIKKW